MEVGKESDLKMFIKLKGILSETDKKSLKKILIWGFLSAFTKSLPYIFIILAATELIKPLTGNSIDENVLIKYFLMMLISYVIMYFFGMKSWNTISKDASGIIRNGRKETLEIFNKLSLGKIKEKNTSESTDYIVDNYNSILLIISDTLDPLLNSIIIPLIGFVSMFFISWQLALVAIAVALITFLLYFAMRKRSVESGKSLNEINEIINAEVLEFVSNIYLLKGFNMGGDKFKRLSKTIHLLKKKSIEKEMASGTLIGLCSTILMLGIPITTITGLYLWKIGSISLVAYMIFIISIPKIYTPLTTEFALIDQLKYLFDAIDHLYELRQTKKLNEGNMPANIKNYDVEFKNVTFSYNEEKNVLENLSFKADMNCITALVGHSGCGKSTILQLIARFYDNQNGKITIGGKDIKEIPYSQLLDMISIVFQESYLFNDTIKNNMLLAKSDATMEEIISAAKKAGCHEWIESLEDGYDTLIGESGGTISGGERQRIAVARAILKDSPIVLLDEATASLDIENEIYVQSSIQELIKGKTVIIVAHHLNTIQNADKIVVINDKTAVEEGNHKQLIMNGKLYCKLWNTQFQMERLL